MAMIDRVKEYADMNDWEITTMKEIMKVEKNGIGTYKKFEITMDLDHLLQQMKDEDKRTSDDVQGDFPFARSDDEAVTEGD